MYGTPNARRGLWKRLHEKLVSCGLKPLPFGGRRLLPPRTCWRFTISVALTLTRVCGQAARNTSALARLKEMSLKFCRGLIKQTDEGIHLSSPTSWTEFIPQDRRVFRAERATGVEISQLRPAPGSISWPARTCRPDLAFGVNQFQSVQPTARAQDLIEANRLFSHAVKTKNKGMLFSKDGPMLKPRTSLEDLGNGRLGGNSSQSGRLLILAPNNFTWKKARPQVGSLIAETFYDHLFQPRMSEVTDNWFAIDLTSLRQDVWRKLGSTHALMTPHLVRRRRT